MTVNRKESCALLAIRYTLDAKADGYVWKEATVSRRDTR